MELAHPNRASILIMPDNFMQVRSFFVYVCHDNRGVCVCVCVCVCVGVGVGVGVVCVCVVCVCVCGCGCGCGCCVCVCVVCGVQHGIRGRSKVFGSVRRSRQTPPSVNLKRTQRKQERVKVEDDCADNPGERAGLTGEESSAYICMPLFDCIHIYGYMKV